MRHAGFDLGPVVEAERMTERGLLRWRIALVAGGRRHADGAVPLLIEWGDVHPADDLPDRGVELRAVVAGGIAPALSDWLGVDAAEPSTSASLAATLSAPRGEVTLLGA